MKRNVDMSEISDGRLYGSGDMVKADTGGCAGCSACCHGMGSSIVLDPLDGYRLSGALQTTFEELLKETVELNVVDGIILPNLRMVGEQEACAFLDGNGRCRIHAARPGICRMFPLGRYYEGRDFRYFLQVHECPKNRTKVKVRKWLDTPQLARYEEYIRAWHYFLEDAQHILDGSGSDALRKQVNLYLLRQFFLSPWDEAEDFYVLFGRRLREAKQFLGISNLPC